MVQNDPDFKGFVYEDGVVIGSNEEQQAKPKKERDCLKSIMYCMFFMIHHLLIFLLNLTYLY